MSPLHPSRLNGRRIWQNIADFGNWWAEQLLSLVPRLTPETPSGKGCMIEHTEGGLILHYTDEKETFEWRHEGSITSLDDEDWEHLRSIIANTGAYWTHSDNMLLALKLNLPAKVSADIGNAVKLYIKTVSPLKPEAISWAYKARRDGKALTADIYLARNYDLDHIDNAFVQQGLLPPYHQHIDGDGQIFTLRKPLQIRSGNAWLWPAALAAPFISVIMGLLITILISGSLASSEKTAADKLANELAPKIEEEARFRKANAVARGIMPVSREPLVTALLEDLAVAIPQDMWVEAAGQTRNGVIEIILIGPNEAAIKNALEKVLSLRIENIDKETVADPQIDQNGLRFIVSARFR